LAKLDPKNQQTALDVMKERELKRKRELEGDHDEANGSIDDLAEATEKPREGMKNKQQKKRKLEDGQSSEKSRGENGVTEDGSMIDSKAAKRKAKEQRRKEKQARQEEKRKAKRARREAAKAEEEQEDGADKPIHSPELQNGLFEPTSDDFESFDGVDLADGPSPHSALSIVAGAMQDDHPEHSSISASPSPPPDSTFSHASKVSTSSTLSTPSVIAPAGPPLSSGQIRKLASEKLTPNGVHDEAPTDRPVTKILTQNSSLEKATLIQINVFLQLSN
jgi:hypothetical protein